VYLQRKDAPNKLKAYPPFEQLFGVLSADVILDGFKRMFAARLVACCVELQNSSTARLAIDDTAWIAKLVKMGALTVASNQFGECVSLMFLASKGKFSEKRAMLRELGERAARRHDPVVAIATDDCPNNTEDYKLLLGTEHHTLDAMHGQRRITSEANNFGYYYAALCNEVTVSMFSYDPRDEEFIDGRLLEGTMKVRLAPVFVVVMPLISAHARTHIPNARARPTLSYRRRAPHQRTRAHAPKQRVRARARAHLCATLQ
jgi:hypothetical protein